MQIAFKEWAVIAEALASGRQTIILRKGGIVEPKGGFRPEHSEFLLLPTYVHQTEAGVIPEAWPLLEETRKEQPPSEEIRLKAWARVTAAFEIRSPQQLAELRPEHLWSDEVIRERFLRWQKDMVHALLVRVYRLPQPVSIPMKPEYGGCKSYVELDRMIDQTGSTPVLDQESFERRISNMSQTLGVSQQFG